MNIQIYLGFNGPLMGSITGVALVVTITSVGNSFTRSGITSLFSDFFLGDDSPNIMIIIDVSTVSVARYSRISGWYTVPQRVGMLVLLGGVIYLIAACLSSEAALAESASNTPWLYSGQTVVKSTTHYAVGGFIYGHIVFNCSLAWVAFISYLFPNIPMIVPGVSLSLGGATAAQYMAHQSFAANTIVLVSSSLGVLGMCSAFLTQFTEASAQVCTVGPIIAAGVYAFGYCTYWYYAASEQAEAVAAIILNWHTVYQLGSVLLIAVGRLLAVCGILIMLVIEYLRGFLAKQALKSSYSALIIVARFKKKHQSALIPGAAT